MSDKPINAQASGDEDGLLPRVGKRGPRRKKLTSNQQDQMIELVRRGAKRVTAVIRVGATTTTLQNTLKSDRAFHRRLVEAEAQRDEQLHTVLYAAALGDRDTPPDLATARYLWDGIQKGKLANRAMKEQQKAREHQARLAGQLLAANAGARDEAAAELKAWRDQMAAQLLAVSTTPPTDPAQASGP